MINSAVLEFWLLWNLLNLAFCQDLEIRECRSTPVPLCPSNVPSEVTSHTVTDDDGLSSTIWSGNSSVFGCQDNRIILSNGVPNHTDDCLPATARLAPPNGNNYTSTLSVTPSSEMDGALIRCYYPTINDLIKECILNITNPPGRPQCASANIETVTTNDPIDSVLVTLNWIEPLSEGNITGYSIGITPPLTIYPTECLEGSTNPCNVSSSVTSLQFQFNLSTSYVISVSAMNCESQLGEPSVFCVYMEERRDGIRLIINTVSVIYDQSSNELKTVTTSWYLADPNVGNITGCGHMLLDVSRSIPLYEVDVTRTGSTSLTSEFVPCCNYTYTPSSEHSSQDSYSIAVSAVNVYGQRTTVETPSSGSINNVLTVTETIAVSSANHDEPNVTLTCHFSSHFQGSSCDITLGTTTTMDLVLTARGEDGVPVHLNAGLNHSYYYTAVFTYEESGVSIVIQVEGQFTTFLCQTQESKAAVNEGCTVAVIAMSAAIPSIIMFITGLLLGLVIMYFVLIKAVTSQAGHGHQLPGPTGGPLYDEISPTSVQSTENFEMGENAAYAGPTTVRRNIN